MSQTGLNPAATLRQPAELVAHGLAPATALADLEKVAARYAIAVTPDIAALIDPMIPTIRSRGSSFRARGIADAARRKRDPIGDHAHSCRTRLP